MGRNWSRAAPERCLVELDHVHNLPSVISDNRIEGLAYYYNVERQLYLRWLEERELKLDVALSPLWETIRVFLEERGLLDADESGSPPLSGGGR